MDAAVIRARVFANINSTYRGENSLHNYAYYLLKIAVTNKTKKLTISNMGRIQCRFNFTKNLIHILVNLITFWFLSFPEKWIKWKQYVVTSGILQGSDLDLLLLLMYSNDLADIFIATNLYVNKLTLYVDQF